MLVKSVVGGSVWQHSGSMDELLICPLPHGSSGRQEGLYYNTHHCVDLWGDLCSAHSRLKRGVHARLHIGTQMHP